MQGWLVTLHCKKITGAKFKEVKTGWSDSLQNRQVWQNHRRPCLKKGSFSDDDDDDDGGGGLLLY
jgi:hypothetical protein